MHITYESTDYPVFLRRLEEHLRLNQMRVIGIIDDKLYTPHFYIRLGEGNLEIVPLIPNRNGPSLVASLDTFVEYCHVCEEWHLEFSNFAFMPRVFEALYLKDWLSVHVEVDAPAPVPTREEELIEALSRITARIKAAQSSRTSGNPESRSEILNTLLQQVVDR